jgi:hypothetical protein
METVQDIYGWVCARIAEEGPGPRRIGDGTWLDDLPTELAGHLLQLVGEVERFAYPDGNYNRAN